MLNILLCFVISLSVVPALVLVTNRRPAIVFVQMNQCLNGKTHGPVHILIGGAWEKTGDEVSWTQPLLSIRSSIRVLLFKMLWRTGFTRCPTNCTSTGTCFPIAVPVPVPPCLNAFIWFIACRLL